MAPHASRALVWRSKRAARPRKRAAQPSGKGHGRTRAASGHRAPGPRSPLAARAAHMCAQYFGGKGGPFESQIWRCISSSSRAEKGGQAES